MKYFIFFFLAISPLSSLMSQSLKKGIDHIIQYIERLPSQRSELFSKCESDYNKLYSIKFDEQNQKIFDLYQSSYFAVLFENNTDSVDYTTLQKKFSENVEKLSPEQSEQYSNFILLTENYIQEIKRYNWKSNYPFMKENRKNKILTLFYGNNIKSLNKFIEDVRKYENNQYIKEIVIKGVIVKLALLDNTCWYDKYKDFNNFMIKIMDYQFRGNDTMNIRNLKHAQEVLFDYYFYDLINTEYFIKQKQLLQSLGTHTCNEDYEALATNARIEKIIRERDSLAIELTILDAKIKNQFSYLIAEIDSSKNSGNCVSCEVWKDSVYSFLLKYNPNLKIENELYAKLIEKSNCYSVSKIKLDEPISIKDASYYFNRHAIRDIDERVIMLRITKNTTYADILNLYSIGIDDPSHLQIVFNRLKFYNVDRLCPAYPNLHEAGKILKKIKPNDLIGINYIYLPNLSALSLKYSSIQGDKDFNVLNLNQLQKNQK